MEVGAGRGSRGLTRGGASFVGIWTRDFTAAGGGAGFTTRGRGRGLGLGTGRGFGRDFGNRTGGAGTSREATSRTDRGIFSINTFFFEVGRKKTRLIRMT
jgi:hypothetical protein